MQALVHVVHFKPTARLASAPESANMTRVNGQWNTGIGHTRIPAVDDLNSSIINLATEFPNICSVETIGASKSGEPLLMLSVGHASERVLVVGGPHPNEPVGFISILHLAHIAIRHPQPVQWNFIPCIDPDGAKLNERWYETPDSIRMYHKYFYRPPVSRQPEWAFPYGAFKSPIPETTSLMQVIDELKPTFLCSLHNTDLEGAHFIVNRAVEGLSEELTAIAELNNIPIESRPNDTQSWPTAGPSVFIMPPSDAMSSMAKAQEHQLHGESSLHYASRHGTLGLITEVPMWIERPSDLPLPLSKTAALMRRDIGLLANFVEQLNPFIDRPSVLLEAVVDTVSIGNALATDWDELDVSPTVAQSVHRRVRLRGAGMLRRLLHEFQTGSDIREVRALTAALDERFEFWCKELEELSTPIPLDRIVALQIGATIAALSHASSR